MGIRIGRALREAIRRWIRRPLFPALGIASVAVAITVNTAVFALVDAVLFKPLAVKEPSTLYDLYGKWSPMVFRPGFYSEIQRRIDPTVVRDVIAFTPTRGPLAEVTGGPGVVGEGVSANYFAALGLVPQVGNFAALSDPAGSAHACVVSDTLWSALFARDPHVVGRVVTFKGVRLEVAGVAPPRFRGLFAPSLVRTDIWMPLAAAEATNRGRARFTSTVRLALRAVSGSAPERLAAAVRSAVSPDVWHSEPSELPRIRFRGATATTRDMDQMLSIASLLALIGAGTVLIAVCANLSIFLMTAAMERRPELAVRRSLGARRTHLTADIVVEPVLMTVFGGLLGVLLARPVLVFLSGQHPEFEGFQLDVAAILDWRVIVFSLSVTSVASIGCALAPLRSLSRLGLATLLGTSEVITRPRAGVLQWILTGTHVAVTVALTAVAVQATRAGVERSGVDLGFDRDLLSFVQLYEEGTAGIMPRAIETVEGRLAALPWVASVSHSTSLPFSADRTNELVGIGDRQMTTRLVRVGPGYFQTFGIRLLRGRVFGPGDSEFLPNAVVMSSRTGAQWFPGSDPLGQVIVVAGTSATVAGVVSDVDHGAGPAMPTLYVPFSPLAQSAYIFVRGRPSITLRALQGALASLPPGIRVERVDSVKDYLNRGPLYPMRASAAMAVLLAVIAAATCVLGQYAVASRAAARRRREMAVRRALGARPRDVLWELIGRQVPSLAVGAGGGIWLVLSTRRFLATFLSGGLHVGIAESVVALTVVLAVGGIACVVAVVRATREPPAMALRQF